MGGVLKAYDSLTLTPGHLKLGLDCEVCDEEYEVEGEEDGAK